MPRALLVLCCAALCSAAVPAAATAPDPPAYVAPVDAPVLDPFRPPSSPYGPGNRGLQYDTPAGADVHAAADGRVVFAGSVAGSLHVTVLHPDGVRTSYSFLASIAVVTGQHVRQGDRLGRTAGPLHLGARRGDAYFDPASLFEAGPPRVHLVAFDEPPGDGTGGERSAIGQLIGGLGGVLGSAGGAVGSVGAWLREGGVQLVRTMDHYARRFTFPASMLDTSFTMWRAWQRARSAADRPCSGADVRPRPPTERRVAVLVAGLGSHSRASTVDHIDTTALGYDAPDVLRFSYAGGLVPDPSDGFGGIADRAYGAEETQADLRVTGARLADVIEEVAAASPSVPIDVYAHSQGGLVARVALVELERRHGTAWLRRVGLVATLGTPHGGADLATAAHAVGSTATGDRALGVFGDLTGAELDPHSPSVGQLGETSDLVLELADHPVPAGVPAISLAARGDVIVPVPRSAAPGMEEVVLPLVGRAAHSDLPGSPLATRELALALAGRPPGCQSFGDALLDQGVGEGISLVEDLAGAAGFLLTARADVRSAGSGR